MCSKWMRPRGQPRIISLTWVGYTSLPTYTATCGIVEMSYLAIARPSTTRGRADRSIAAVISTSKQGENVVSAQTLGTSAQALKYLITNVPRIDASKTNKHSRMQLTQLHPLRLYFTTRRSSNSSPRFNTSLPLKSTIQKGTPIVLQIFLSLPLSVVL
jgi:hypothetical protein